VGRLVGEALGCTGVIRGRKVSGLSLSSGVPIEAAKLVTPAAPTTAVNTDPKDFNRFFLSTWAEVVLRRTGGLGVVELQNTNTKSSAALSPFSDVTILSPNKYAP
jgi:hypothetical protein